MGHTLDNQSLCCTLEIAVGSTQLPAVYLFSPPGQNPSPSPLFFKGDKVADIGNTLSGKVDWIQEQEQEESFALLNDKLRCGREQL
jgi:hypothetical protein